MTKIELSVFTTLLLLIICTNAELKIVTNSGYWLDDFNYTDFQDTSGALQSWTNPANLRDLAVTSTCNGNACTDASTQDADHIGKVWGWWDSYYDNNAYQMSRAFSCDRHSQVDYKLMIYFCTEGGAANQYIYIDTTAGKFPNIYSRRDWIRGDETTMAQTDGQSNPTGTFSDISGSGGSNQPGTTCSATLTTFEYSTTFETTPDTIFTVTVYNSISSSSDNRATAFNSFRVRCVLEPTPSPTESPTQVTGTPSATPTTAPTSAPSATPTAAPTDIPSDAPTTRDPTASPTTPIPTQSPTRTPTADPTKTPTMDPTRDPTPRPTDKPVQQPTTPAPVSGGIDEQFSNAFSGGGECMDDGGGWIECNLIVFIILVIIGVVFILYWIFGAVWYKRRQNNRPVPAHMLVTADGAPNTGVEMGGTGATTHATADKWKSAWEIEQEQKRAAENAHANGPPQPQGDAVYGGNDGW